MEKDHRVKMSRKTTAKTQRTKTKKVFEKVKRILVKEGCSVVDYLQIYEIFHEEIQRKKEDVRVKKWEDRLKLLKTRRIYCGFPKSQKKHFSFRNDRGQKAKLEDRIKVQKEINSRSTDNPVLPHIRAIIDFIDKKVKGTDNAFGISFPDKLQTIKNINENMVLYCSVFLSSEKNKCFVYCGHTSRNENVLDLWGEGNWFLEGAKAAYINKGVEKSDSQAVYALYSYNVSCPESKILVYVIGKFIKKFKEPHSVVMALNKYFRAQVFRNTEILEDPPQ